MNPDGKPNMTKLIWGGVFLAGYWFTPKSLWLLGVAFLIIGISLIVSVLLDLYRRNLGGPTPQQAFSLSKMCYRKWAISMTRLR